MKQVLKKLIPQRLLNLYHKSLALLGTFLFCYPSEKLIIIGVTGTKGKSSTCNLIASILNDSGYKTGLSTTINFKIGDQEWINDKKMTMLGRFALQKMLKKMVDAGCRYAVIETSSQGVQQFRHLGINYDIGVFTNLTPEHIEAHGGFENYKKAKLNFFLHLAQSKHKVINGKRIIKQIIINIDDENAGEFLNFSVDKKIGYKIYNHQNPHQLDHLIYANGLTFSKNGINFSVDSHLFDLKLFGEFNIYNALAAISTAYSQKISFDAIKNSLERIKLIPGRMEFIQAGQDFNLVVDYAHEPASLTQVYKTIFDSNFLHTDSKIIHILGSCGGGRDTARREVLGNIAAQKADIVIVTNEDPYDEDPLEIINQVAQGATNYGKILNKDLFLVPDRRQAIKKAVKIATKNDFILITGKGSEQAICVKSGKKIPWDDRKVALEEILKNQYSVPKSK